MPESRADPGAVKAARQFVGVVEGLLGADLISGCLYGSAVHGGLRPDSDLDVFVLAARTLTGAERQTLTRELLRGSGRFPPTGAARPVELTVVVRSEVVPWRYPPRRDFQYGEWLRADLEVGHWPRSETDPDLAVLLSTVRDHCVVLAGAHPAEVLDAVPSADLRRAIRDSLPALLADLDGDERNVVLTLARMWVTLETGEIVAKDVAAAHVASRLEPPLRAVVELAREAYLGRRRDDWSSMAPALTKFVDHARGEIEQHR